MTISHFALQDFRNLTKLSIDPSSKLNIVYGNNGSGKTSLMEAIFYLGRARSFRTSHVQHLIAHNKTAFVCFGKITDQQGLGYSVGVRRTLQDQVIKINKQLIQRTSELAHILPMQIINNDVHHLIDGGPKVRRQFLDWGVFHLNPQYSQLMKQFRHTLRQRNAALKQKWKRQDIQHWDSSLGKLVSEINTLRLRYLEQFIPMYEHLMQDSFNLPPVKINYRSGWEKNLDYSTALAEHWDLDLQRGLTHYGPHKADLRLSSNKQPLKEVVSRGQQKIIGTLLVLAQILVYQNSDTKNHKGSLVLLIDDLPAELDRDFSRYFIDKILQTDTQVFVTATDHQLLPLPTDVPRKVFHVEHGEIHEMDGAANNHTEASTV